jgi:uncharacterized glyoxalase superfamily protein PhnB
MTQPAAALIPCLRYHDAPAAIDWLCRVFGFESHLVVPGEAGAILHAELRIDTGKGIGMIMVGSSGRGGAYGDLMVQPTRGARARDAGAAMLIDLADEAHGGRGFTCRDPDGHVWSIGTYAPAPV